MASHGSDASNQQRVQTTTSETRQLGPVDVEIQGRTLSVKSDRDPEFVQRLADYIDEKLTELRESAPNAPNDKLLMLASMTVAEELFEMRAEVEDLRGEIRERTETMRRLLDELEG